MIQIYLGNVGSGKTAHAVREILSDKNDHRIITNIKLKTDKDNVEPLRHDMIFHTRFDERKNKLMPDKLNLEFWQGLRGPTTLILDEAHTLLNPRKAMSKINIVMGDFLALIRRVLGSAESGSGQLILITQLFRRLDPIARDMASVIKTHVCHYNKQCRQCGTSWVENSETPEPVWKCYRCNGNKITKFNHVIEVKEYAGVEAYNAFLYMGANTHFRHYYIQDIERVFPEYNTLSWDNLLSVFY